MRSIRLSGRENASSLNAAPVRASGEVQASLSGPTAGCSVVLESVNMEFEGPGGGFVALRDINLSVSAGEFVCIVGPSGCGKTTLLRLIQGLEAPTSGTVDVAGQKPGGGLSSFVFQRASLFPWRTVRRNVSFGIELNAMSKRKGRKIGASERDAIVNELLELIELADFANFYPRQISGGMQQRVNVARALATEPAVLLMDEPFSALDAMTRERLQRDVHAIVSARNTTTIFITHDIREAAFLADRVVIMSGRPGSIVDIIDIAEPRPREASYQNSERLANVARKMWKTLHPEG